MVERSHFLFIIVNKVDLNRLPHIPRIVIVAYFVCGKGRLTLSRRLREMHCLQHSHILHHILR